jgi:ketosteroid isomerase-like protein
MKSRKYFGLVLILSWLCACRSADGTQEGDTKAVEAEKLYDLYVANWLDQDSVGLMNMITEDCVLMPSNLSPVMGKKAIEKFWFPNNNSKMVINTFTTNLISSKIVDDTMAVTVHDAIMDWNYDLDTLHLAKLQRTISTTIFKKRKNNEWKMWHQSWVNYKVDDKPSSNTTGE